MPIRWSALQLAEAVDEIERVIAQAEPFLAEAEKKTRRALGIPSLPEYMAERLRRLEFLVGRNLQDATGMTAKVREHIPKDAIEAERHSGKQQGLGLKSEPCSIRKRNDFDFWLKQQIKR